MAVNHIAGAGSHASIVADAARANASRAQPQSARGEEQTSSTSDTFSLTGTARQLRALQAQLVSQPVVDSGRVNLIKNDLSAGTFVIDPPRVAQKMLDIETMLNDKVFA